MNEREFDRGDVVSVNLQSSSISVLVLSTAVFNATGLVLVAPITEGHRFARHAGFAVQLSGTETEGVVLMNQVRMLDLEARGAKRKERVPEAVVEDALARLQAIINP